MQIKAGDLILDSFYYNTDLNPLFVFYYVLDVFDNRQGEKVVKLAPPIYKNLIFTPKHNHLMSEIPSDYKIRKCKAWEYSIEDVIDKENNKIGLHFIPLKQNDRWDYTVIFEQYRQ